MGIDWKGTWKGTERGEGGDRIVTGGWYTGGGRTVATAGCFVLVEDRDGRSAETRGCGEDEGALQRPRYECAGGELDDAVTMRAVEDVVVDREGAADSIVAGIAEVVVTYTIGSLKREY